VNPAITLPNVFLSKVADWILQPNRESLQSRLAEFLTKNKKTSSGVGSFGRIH
jgi:hypothetical protein